MHTKYYNDEGVEVPSVTTVIKILNKPVLMYWANSLGFKNKSYKKELERTAVVGTMVHEFIEHRFSNKLYSRIKEVNNLDEQSANEALLSYFAFRNWYKHNKDNLKIIHSEKKFVSNKHNYGGTIDLIAEYKGKLYIIDFKTSTKVHASMFLQLSAYANMVEEYGINIERVGILRLCKKTGIPQFVTMSRKKNDIYFDTFLNLKSVYSNWGNILKEDWNEEL